jgi:hypothetical protein
MTSFLSKRALAVALAVTLIAPSAALAQSSNEGYGGPNNVVAGIDDQSPPSGDTSNGDVAGTTVESPQAATLPFTGADLGVLAVAGALLLALGFGLRRLTQRPSSV